jgi:trehalose/maltose transport system permease protein
MAITAFKQNSDLYNIANIPFWFNEPPTLLFLPLSRLIAELGLQNSLWSLVLVYPTFTIPFCSWLMMGFFKALPAEIEEAAIVDGASPWVIVTQVFMPLMLPALVTTGLLAFITAWNEFLFALTFTSSDTQRTVPVAIALLSGNSEFEIPWGNIMAASVIVTVPVVVLVLIFQRRIISGLTAGGVKG